MTRIDTVTRVVLLQHPRERTMAIGTAHMASLCLPNSELHVGFRLSESEAVQRALSDPARPAALLYPGRDAIDITTSPPTGPVTLVVIDGTWAQSRKMLRENPALAALPRYAFTPAAPSEYRIRREPSDACVSTIEALVTVLGALERDPPRFAAMMAPFRAMVEAQLAYAATHHAVRLNRSKRARAAPKPDALASPVPTWVPARAHDLVCVATEAIVWPYSDRGPDTDVLHPTELIHLVACRLATGEVFERIVAPIHVLAPDTTTHSRLDAETIHAGVSRACFVDDWRSWARDEDVLVSWGPFSVELIEGAGGFVPRERLDLRQLARLESGHVFRTPTAFAERLGLSPDPLVRAKGRAGERLAAMVPAARRISRPAGEGAGSTR